MANLCKRIVQTTGIGYFQPNAIEPIMLRYSLIQTKPMSSTLKPFAIRPFNPPAWLSHPHVQSVFASLKLRRPFMRARAKEMLTRAQPVILHGDDDVRLSGFYSEHSPDAPLAVLIHGWEGHAESLYMLSCGAHLLANGYSVFRLQLRDHGDSHHLNEEVFHSCRLEETAEAVRQIQLRYQPSELFLGGFSLGGNFSLRIARIAPEIKLNLSGVCAVSPVIDPAPTLAHMENGPAIYRSYFMRKWGRSLRRKNALFPNAIDVSVLKTHRTLLPLTQVLVETVGGFDDVMNYFDGYSVRGERLSNLSMPTSILAAIDDPIVPDQPLTEVAYSSNLLIHRENNGGHCGFLENLHKENYADYFMLEWFNTHRQ